MPKHFRVALVGCGDVAEHGHVPAILEHPRFQLTAVCDIRFERAALMSQKGREIRALTDYRELLDRPDLDAVVLALHPEVSVDVAIDFLRHGKAVLDEKPLARALEDGERLAREVIASRGIYQIGFVMRQTPFVKTLTDVCRSIGTPAFYQVGIFDERWESQYDVQELIRYQQILLNSSVINHEGSHIIDYFHLWNSSVLVSVRAMAMKSSPNLHGPNVWSAQFEVADGSILQVNIGWFVPGKSLVHVVGSQGTVSLDPINGLGEFLDRQGRTEKIQLGRLTQNWAAQLDLFAEAIERGEAQVATVWDGLRALRATLACEESYRRRSEVTIPIMEGQSMH